MLDLLINSTNLFLEQSKNLLKEVYSYELCKIKINNIVDDIENFDLSIIDNNSKIGITASASSPEILVKKILKNCTIQLNMK